MVQIPNSSAPRETIFSDKAVLGSLFKWLWFEFRASGLRLIRFGQNRFQPRPFARSISPISQQLHLLAESSTPLWTSVSAGEQHLVSGKVQNLRVAARKLDGLILRPGEIFSFWSIVGPPTRARGFVAGRELREGCMVANVGGGLCQLSNGLHLVALDGGLDVIERHAHSRIVPGSIAETGKDATVFWNYKDLRFKSKSPCVIRVQLTRSRLIVRLLAPEISPEPSSEARIASEGAAANHHSEHAHDCVECRHRDCVNFIHSTVAQPKTSLFLDAIWPEFDHWLLGQHLVDKDQALLPINGERRNHANYHWFAGHASKPSIREHYLFAGYRAWRSRRLASQGAARQAALLKFDAHLARIYAREIAFDSDRLIIALPFLSTLKQQGVLGGREVSVLLTRAPLLMLQEVLDTAASLYPQSKTIRDFRVPPRVVDLEMEALEAAHLLVTPHLGVAEFLRKCGMNHVELLPWMPPKQVPTEATGSQGSKTVLFPASALARKGAYELREALQDSDIALRVLGKAQEELDFWGGRVRLDKGQAGHPLEGVSAVVLPSHLENQPRLLLQALALSIPVICTSGCGLPSQRGVSFVTAGNANELRDVLSRICEKID